MPFVCLFRNIFHIFNGEKIEARVSKSQTPDASSQPSVKGIHQNEDTMM